jgi:ferritin
MDNLIYEVVADTEKDAIETDYDNSNVKAESVNHRLNERIEHINLVLTHLKDIKRHFENVHKMAKSLVESDATADFVKKFAIEQLNDSVDKVEKCDSCWT